MDLIILREFSMFDIYLVMLRTCFKDLKQFELILDTLTLLKLWQPCKQQTVANLHKQ